MGTEMIDLEQKIRERAYQIWEQEGRIHGRNEEHWHLAKLELTAAEMSAAAIEAPVLAAEPAKKKGRRAAEKPAVAPAAAAAAPRRRRTSATLQ